MGNKNTLILSGAVVLLIFVFSFFYLIMKSNVSTEELNTALEESQLEINTVPPSTNPLTSVAPSGNLVEKTNPFKYENPFE